MLSINGGVQELKINLENIIYKNEEKVTIDSLDLNFIFECLLSENCKDINLAKEYLHSKGLTFLLKEYGKEPFEISFFTQDGDIIFKSEQNDYFFSGQFEKYKGAKRDIINEEIQKLKKSINFYCKFTKDFWID